MEPSKKPTSSKKKDVKWVACSFDNLVSSSSQDSDTGQKKYNKKRPRQTKSTRSFTYDTNESWLQKFAPREAKDLAVHSRKVADVKKWILEHINESCTSRDWIAPMLLLTGPSGAGKTETVRVIAKENGVDLIEWTDMTSESPYVNWQDEPRFSSGGDFISYPQSQMSLFSDFLFKASKYSVTLSSSSSNSSIDSKKLILVDEFPNAFYLSPSNFHAVLRKCAKKCQCPIVFVVTENRKDETFEHELFPQQLQSDLHITHISFNPVAPTILMKMLLNICEQLKSCGLSMPTKAELETLVENSNGDIRSAINVLEMKCSPGSAIRPVNSTSLSDVSNHANDSHLNLFHTLGKVLYCKRSEQNIGSSVKPPLIEDPEVLIDHASASGENFVLYLHQNLLDFTDSIETAESCVQRLSEADSMAADWNNRGVWNEYSLSHAVRGLMYHLPTKPVANKWRPVEKPEWYAANRMHKEHLISIRSLLKGRIQEMGERELVTSYLPFIQLSNQKKEDASIAEAVNQISAFTLSKMGSSNAIVIEPNCLKLPENDEEIQEEKEEWTIDEASEDDN